jgi:murein DD-endopeptidase MepM/ murein hydrolase activator NlpD
MSSSARVSTGAFFLCLMLALPHQSLASTSQNIPALVDKYATKYAIPLHIARNLVRGESGGRQSAVSPSGARGVMQLTPATAKALGVDINDPEQNIEGGMRYLRQQYDRFGRWDLALAAYHSGPHAVIRHGDVPPKSKAYVRSILGPTPVASRGTLSRHHTSQLAGGFAWPVEGPITNGFGGGLRGNHAGIDISAPRGTTIRASKAGTVAHASWYYDYGYSVILDHGGGVSSLYGHVSKLLVRVGQAVKEGEVIALVGCTGRCTGPHVHFEVRVNGRAVDPLSIRAVAATSPERRSPATTSRAPAKATTTNRQPVTTRQSVKVAEDTVTTTTETLENGRIVRRVEVTLFGRGQLRVRIVREFRLVSSVMRLVNEQTQVYLVGDDGDRDDDHEKDMAEDDDEGED